MCPNDIRKDVVNDVFASTEEAKVELKDSSIKKNNKNYEKKIVIIGSGAFGTAIAEVLVRDKEKNNKILLFGINEKEIHDINSNGKNSKYYSLKLSPNLKGTTDPKEAFVDSDIIMFAVPSIAIKSVIEKTVVPNITKPAYFINLAKGFDYLDDQILSKTIKELVPKELNKAVLKLAGSSYASELIEKEPTWFVLASDNIEDSKIIAKELNNNTMKVRPVESLDTVEWLSIIKNPLALLQGIVAGLGYKVNTRALFFEAAVEEMRLILQHFELNEDLLFSPAGLGDFYLTGSSRKSRNYSTGFMLGKVDKVTKKVLTNFATVEGVRSVEVLLHLARKNNLNLKLIEILYNITYKKDKKPSEVINKYLKEL